MQLHFGKMYFQDLLCIPSALTAKVIREHHRTVGHLASIRFWSELEWWHHWAVAATAKRLCFAIPQYCELCQAAEQAHHSLQTKVEHMIVPSRLMEAVSIDIFQMPQVEWDRRVVDCFALCVDRMSGWHIATVHNHKGLTAAEVARAMYFQGWSFFGIPNRIRQTRDHTLLPLGSVPFVPIMESGRRSAMHITMHPTAAQKPLAKHCVPG